LEIDSSIAREIMIAGLREENAKLDASSMASVGLHLNFQGLFDFICLPANGENYDMY
jgi:hypothetical protein